MCETLLTSRTSDSSCIALFTAFSAASVLVAASLVPELEERYQLPGERLSQAINVLTSHRWQIDGASSAKEQLEQFMATVEGIKARRGAVTGALNHVQSSSRPAADKE